MTGTSIRLRLTLWYSGVLLAGLAVFGAGMWLALNERLMGRVETQLTERVEGLRTVLELESQLKDSDLRLELAEFAREVPEGGLMSVRDARGGELLTSTLQLTPGATGYRTVEVEGRKYRVLGRRVEAAGEAFDVAVAVSLAGTSAMLAELRQFLLLMIPAVLAVACLGGYWISRRALSPVDEITRTAQSISVQNLSLRLPVAETGDELARMSEAWNGVLERLEAAVGRIRQFTADASHELRSPIAVIRGTADLALLRERTPEDYQNALREIREEAERMTELTETLLALARSDAGGMSLPCAAVDLHELVEEVVASQRKAAEAKGVGLEAVYGQGRATVAANRPALQRMLLALVDNALKYTEAGGRVSVSAKIEGGAVRVAVEDTGSGIAPEALGRVFERFYRADAVRGSGTGSGLGLSIAQAIAEAHGTSLRVESTPGVGSRFQATFRLDG